MKKFDALRLNLFLIFVLAVSGLILYRLFILSYLKHSAYQSIAQAQNDNISDTLVRGNIFLENPGSESGLFLAATNKKFPLAYTVPADINVSDIDNLAQTISSILGIDEQSVANTLKSKSNYFKILADKISSNQADQISALNVKGVGVSYEMDRFYPADQLAANIIGYFGYDNQGKSGQYGVESYYNGVLTGTENENSSNQPQSSSGAWSAIKNFITGDGVLSPNAGKPADIVLTIDKNIQLFVENKLDTLMKTYKAAGGTIIVQDPNTGKILAMADRPTFNPNSYSSYDPSTFLDHSIQGIFEPGSSFKPITMATGLELNKITTQTSFFDTGYVDIAGYRIKNFNNSSFGNVTMTQVLEKSINTGAMFVENLVGDDNFLNGVVNMGFGQKTGIDMPGELSGNITNLYSGRKINFLTASFGQGIAVTPLQLIDAYSAIANGGKLMKPYVVDKIVYEGGNTKETKPEVVSIPISETTSSKLKTMLVSVVDKGFDKARINGYDVAGKTGTAQIPDDQGGYLANQFIHDFLGFAPAYNPRFVILIKLDKPQGITYASDSLSPTFKDIAQFLLNYYNIPPTRK